MWNFILSTLFLKNKVKRIEGYGLLTRLTVFAFVHYRTLASV